MNNTKVKELLTNMFAILDIVETSDMGREFRPTHFTSCRVLDGQQLNSILLELKQQLLEDLIIHVPEKPSTNNT